MDASEYLPMFLAEAREHLQELNLAIVSIEENPDDRETADEIFRIAHSFKGMSATMGFAGTARLTHEMENVLELLRQRRGGLSRDAIDVLLECLDALSGAVDSVDENGEETIAPDALIERLEGLTREDAAEIAVRGPQTARPDIEALATGRRYVHMVIGFADDISMPSVRAYMVVAALGEHGEVFASVPQVDDLDGFDAKEFELWLATDHEDEIVAGKARSVADVSTVTLDAPGAVEPEAPATRDPRPAAPKHAKKPASSTVRVDSERLDQLMHFMGELVVHRTTVEGLVEKAHLPGLAQAMQELTRSSQSLQTMVMQVRMIEVEAVFLRFPRLVRDLSTKLGKQVDLKLTGGETELDRTVVDALGDPMVHLVRNSLDHALEPPEERRAAGKPETGSLEISARHAGGNVIISVTDDGRGIDPRRIAQKAAERGLIGRDELDSVDMVRAIELLFAPGFSTAEVTNDISGRGVGMDAVRSTVRALGGEVLMQSEHGTGTSAQIRLPLTLAIMSALLVESGGLPYAIPLDRVERTLRLEDHAVRSVAGSRMLVMREGVLPLLEAASTLGGASAGDPTYAVIVRAGERRIALSVEHLVGQRELVTRPLPPELGSRTGVSGGAVLSNGGIALIVDCDALAGPGSDRVAPTTAKAA
jgi:two-component system chemotaxis sensor kinase CheA